MGQPELRFALRLAASIGCTLEEMGSRMSAEEFGLHYALHLEEPLDAPTEHAFGSVIAAIANGTLKTPAGRLWQASDFFAKPWTPETTAAPQVAPTPQTAAEIMARVRAAEG